MRLRPFAQTSISYLPGVDIGFAIDLSDFGSSNLVIESTADGYWVAGIAGGLVMQLSDQWLAEVGIMYEIPLTDLEVDLGFDIAGNAVPLDATLEPQGLVGFIGVTWIPRRFLSR